MKSSSILGKNETAISIKTHPGAKTVIKAFEQDSQPGKRAGGGAPVGPQSSVQGASMLKVRVTVSAPFPGKESGIKNFISTRNIIKHSQACDIQLIKK